MNTTKAASSALLLAELILKAAEIRENSFDHKALEEKRKLNPDTFVSNDYYRKSMEEACKEACGEDCAVFTELLHAALLGVWNETIEWAQIVTGRQLKREEA